MKYLKYILFIILLIPLNVFAKLEAPVDITKMSIKDLSEALDKGYLTSELLVELYLERIEAYNSEFNAIREINENALEDAKRLDKERNNGNVRSELHGIPILVKTNIDVLGLATTAGSKTLSDNYPNEDALVIKKLKEAGAIILGSTNMSEFAFLARDSYSSYGHVKNAFNINYSPYGSSGGSAVAVATSFAAATLGTDTNSSVRLPASAASLVGLRPTFDLISTDGVIPYDITRDTIGILTKTVSDNALILSVLSNNENKKDYKNKNALTNIKIGVIKSYLEGSNNKTGVNSKTDADIMRLAKEKISLLESVGYEIVYIDELLDETYIKIASGTMAGDSFCDGFNKYIKNTTSSIKSFQDLVTSSNHVYSLTGYLEGCGDKWLYDNKEVETSKNVFEKHILKVMENNDIDVIAYPTSKIKNLKLNEIKSLNAPGSFLGSVIGYPSITVPMGYIDEFSYGLEFLSTKYSEDKLYFIAESFEKINDLEIVNSPLAPSLYEIPILVNELKIKYEEHYEEKRYQDIALKTKKYFKSYNEIEEKENVALELINEYKRLEKINYKSSWLYIIIIILLNIISLYIISILKSKVKQIKLKLKGV